MFGNAGVLREFSKPTVLAYARARQPQSYLGLTLFPEQTTNALTFEYFKGVNGLPIMASVQAFGAEARQASREGLDKISGGIPTIKRKIPLTGQALIALKRSGAGDIDFVRNTLYNDLDTMIDACLARVEKLRMDAVADGVITLAENGVIMTVDYGVPAGNKEILAGVNLWSDAVNCNPVADIQRWVDAVVNASGVKPTRALTSSTVVSNMVKSANLRKQVFGDNGASRILTVADVNALLGSLELPLIAAYDTKARMEAEDGVITTVRLFNEKKFVLLPPSVLGDTLVGPTEESLMDPDVSAQETAGVYAIVYQEQEPPKTTTKAAISAIPTFPQADAVFQAQVLA